MKDLNPDHGFKPNTRPFIAQEVIDHGGEAISKYEYSGMGTVTEFKFQDEIGRAFRGENKLKWLISWGPSWGFLPSDEALVFVTNHDSQRDGSTLTYKNAKPYRMAIAFQLAHPYGVSRIMSSYYFDNREQSPPTADGQTILSPIIFANGSCGNGWVCEHRWRQIYNMIGFKNAVRGTGLNDWWDNGNNRIAFCRGTKGFVAFNLEKSDLNEGLQTCMQPGKYCDVISGSKVNGKCTGKTVNVRSDGRAKIYIGMNEDDGVLAIHSGMKLYVQESHE